MASALDLSFFFENNEKLIDVEILYRNNNVTPEQSAQLSTALSNVSLKRLFIRCFSIGITIDRSFEQILSACQKVNYLKVQGLKENLKFTALAELLRAGTMEKIYLIKGRDNAPNLDIQMAERELLESLNQNSRLRSFKVMGLFRGEGAGESIKNVLCNTTSIVSVCQSNHTLETIVVVDYAKNEIKLDDIEEYLKLNKSSNKRKVVQCKLMKYYFSRHVVLSSPDQSNNPMRSIANMPLGLLSEILGIDIPEKQSAVFNIIKCIPELCDVSSRYDVHAERSSNSENSSRNERQKVTL